MKNCNVKKVQHEQSATLDSETWKDFKGRLHYSTQTEIIPSID